MNATVNAHDEFAKGRLPSEMSRPTSDTRAGFVEAQGSGMQILTTADLALKIGLPIYGVVAASTMAADKISRSVPAPGQGVLSFARQTSEASRSPFLDMDFRRRGMGEAIRRAQLGYTNRLQEEYRTLEQQHPFVTDGNVLGTGPENERENLIRFSTSVNVSNGVNDIGASSSKMLSNAVSAIRRSMESEIREIRRRWGNECRRQDPDISPLRAALATWGLTVDDIDFVSLHATSTKANDKNEPEIINKQMSHLNRTIGNPLLAICQKSITGHPKAPAAAFMLNGCLQVLNTGLVPGNHNADNVDADLSTFAHLTFPAYSIQTNSLKAFSLTSFGFGQKGGQLIGIHPRFLYGTIDRTSYESYAARVTNRTRSCNHAYLYAMLENRIVACKTVPQYAPVDQDAVLLNPHSRISIGSPQGEARRFEADKLEGTHQGIEGISEVDRFMSTPDNAPTPRSTESTDTATSTSATSINSNLCAETLGTKAWLEEATACAGSEQNIGVGVDLETTFSNVDLDARGTFAQRNYTENERAIAICSADPRHSFTGKWSAKEAVFKSLGVKSKGAGAQMKDIEILPSKEGGPVVKV